MIAIALGPFALISAIAALLGSLGFAVKREKIEGEAYYREHLEGYYRSKTYALRHPVQATKRALRRMR